MCIAVLSTAHPGYRLILVDNRDEYLNRPTAVAGWWPAPHTNILGGRDLLKAAQGTWLGISKQGKIAVLTNFREDPPPPPDAVSRGVIIRKWLTEDYPSTAAFAAEMIESGTAKDAGGFSLVCGHVGEKLAVVSNRARDHSQIPWICGDVIQTVGLSNAAFTDTSWKKVTDGEELTLQIIRECLRDGSSEDVLIQKLLSMLSLDTLPRQEDDVSVGLTTYVKQLRNTIFVPALGRKEAPSLPGDEIAAAHEEAPAKVILRDSSATQMHLGTSGLYGTQKHTIVLVDHKLNVRFFERTLYDADANPVPLGSQDLDYKFKIEA